MTSPTAPEQKTLLLPMALSTLADLSRTISELEKLDGFLQDGAIRQPGSPMQLPKTSKLFDDLVSGSKLNMLQPADREFLMTSLRNLRDKAPVLHVSFSTEPSALFLERLTTWLRQNISPYVLVQVGLHPNIGAGCVVRTTNKYFDFSLRQKFLKQRPLLMQQITGKTAATPQPATEAVA